jgi:hypothetical protein
MGHKSADCHSKPGNGSKDDTSTNQDFSQPKCYRCNKMGQMAYQCPTKDKKTGLVIFTIHDNNPSTMTLAQRLNAEQECVIEAGVMLWDHENRDPRARSLGLGRGRHCFQATNPNNDNQASKPDHNFEENIFTFSEVVEDDDPHNVDAYNMNGVARALLNEDEDEDSCRAIVAEEEDGEDDINSCPSLEDDDYSQSSGESSEAVEDKGKRNGTVTMTIHVRLLSCHEKAGIGVWIQIMTPMMSQ